MVGHDHPGGGRGFFDQLAEDPLVATAAIGAACGVGEPLALLERSGTDWMVATAVIKKAHEYENERHRALVKGIGDAVGDRVARLLVEALRPR